MGDPHRPRSAVDRPQLRILTIVDTFSRYAPAVDARSDARCSYRAKDVVATLDRICAEVRIPKTIRVDHGSEFVSRDLDLWACPNGVILNLSRPGKPTDKAFIEAFNGWLEGWIHETHAGTTNFADAWEMFDSRRRYYNEGRLYEAIGYNAQSPR